MNRQYWIWAILTFIAIAGTIWLVAPALLGQRHGVSLKVRNAPLAEVVKAIQKQTGDDLKVDGKLEALVTLNVKNKALSDVLDRVAEQIGADWTTVYAVYDSPQALLTLEAILPAEENLQDSGWKKIAPGELGGPRLDHEIRAPGPGLSAPPGRVVTETEDVVARDAGTNRFKNEPGFKQMHHNRPAVVVVRKRGDSDSVEQEVWSPVELLMESRLYPRLTNDFSGAATREEAVQASHEAHGHLKIYYALHKSKFAAGPVGMPRMQRGFVHGGPGAAGPPAMLGGTNDFGMQLSSAGQNLEEAVRRQKLEELGRLTPEQRVLRSRERQHSLRP